LLLHEAAEFRHTIDTKHLGFTDPDGLSFKASLDASTDEVLKCTSLRYNSAANALTPIASDGCCERMIAKGLHDTATVSSSSSATPSAGMTS